MAGIWSPTSEIDGGTPIVAVSKTATLALNSRLMARWPTTDVIWVCLQHNDRLTDVYYMARQSTGSAMTIENSEKPSSVEGRNQEKRQVGGAKW